MKTWQSILFGSILIALIALVVFVLPVPVHSQMNSVTLLWTASGDDGVAGRGTSYEMRYRTTPIVGTDTLSWWNGGTVVNMVGKVPVVSGQTDSMVVSGTFFTGTNYYFLIKQCDEVPNCSGYSNVAIKFFADTIPPSRIIDLR